MNYSILRERIASVEYHKAAYEHSKVTPGFSKDQIHRNYMKYQETKDQLREECKDHGIIFDQ